MKKKIFIGILALLFIVVVAIRIDVWIESTTPGDGSEEKEEIEYLNSEIDLLLLLYGEDVNFPEELEYKKIDSLESENWQKDNDYVYLIINDLNSSVNFDKKAYLKLVEYADKNTNFNFYYIGTEALDMIQSNTTDCNLDSEDMSFGYVINEGTRLIHYGLWSKNDHQYLDINPSLLSESIQEMVLMHVKSNE